MTRIDSSSAPVLYAKLIYSEKSKKVLSLFKTKGNKDLNPFRYIDQYCNVRMALIIEGIFISTRTKLAALYSATKSLQNSCTAKLQLFSSILEAKQQLHSSCSGMQKRCAAFEDSLKLSGFCSAGADFQTLRSSCSNATIQLRSIRLS